MRAGRNACATVGIGNKERASCHQYLIKACKSAFQHVPGPKDSHLKQPVTSNS